MKIVTVQALLATVAERYRAVYEPGPAYRSDGTVIRWRDKLQRLEALGPHPAARDVRRVLGNDSWSSLRCSECSRQVPAVAVARGFRGLSTSPPAAQICAECLAAALAAMETTQHAEVET